MKLPFSKVMVPSTDSADPDDRSDPTLNSADGLIVEDLRVGYGLPICPPITLSVVPGSIVAVVGANGCGKSTLLRTVAGRLPPLHGRLKLFGAAVDDRSRAFRTRVAVEVGDDTFFPALTVREHLLLTCYGHGVENPETVTDAHLDEFGLVDRAEALPAALSSGQRRRLLLAAVFARPRSLMILDEPEQRLDSAMRDNLVKHLIAERERRGSVLVATHDPRVVHQIATSVVALSDREVRVLDAGQGADAIRREL